jgi:hypothetical protein
LSVLSKALQQTSLDDALRLVQEALGIKEMEVAAMVFSGVEDWHLLSRDERAKWLSEYVKLEVLYGC